MIQYTHQNTIRLFEMKLSLVGLFSHSDKFGRLHFVNENNSDGKKSTKKIERIHEEINGRSPMTNKGFMVIMNKKSKTPIDITQFIGCHCNLSVFVKKYEFTNTEGENVRGFTLVLKEIYKTNES